ncbi:MAG: acyltransferase [Paramuribaculum sp.]|nr:acyltransferase [Paramuribaculum sp.]
MNPAITRKERIAYLDVIRLVAFFFLLCCHAADPFYASSTYASGGESVSPEMLSWGTRWMAAVRPCVPLFVMLTGALCLPVAGGMGSFYRKRVTRVAVPFLIWSVIYYMTPWFTGLFGFDPEVVRYLFVWAESDDQSLASGLENVAKIPYTFNFLGCHLWYIYMLIGLYLFMPILSAWVEKATKKQIEGVLGLWALSTFLPYITEFVDRYTFGTCEWNSFGLFYYFAGFNGYLLLGYYLVRYTNLSLVKTIALSLPLLMVGYAVTYAGYNEMTSLPSPTPEQIELFWTYNTPNVAMMTIGWFLILKKVKVNATAGRILANLTACGFGIYMIHYFFVRTGYEFAVLSGVPVWFQIPISALVILVFSWPITFFIVKLTGKWSVYLTGSLFGRSNTSAERTTANSLTA